MVLAFTPDLADRLEALARVSYRGREQQAAVLLEEGVRREERRLARKGQREPAAVAR